MAYGYEHLFGINKGDAQIVDSSGILGTYQKQLYNAERQRQAEDEQLAKVTADFDADGVRSADSEEVAKRYDKILDINKAFQNSRDKKERLNLRAQLQQSKADLEQAVNRSKQAKEIEKQYGQLTLSDKRDLLQDGFVNKYGQLRQTSIFDDKYNSLSSDSIFQNPFREVLWDNDREDKIVTRSIKEIKGYKQGGTHFINYDGKQLDKQALAQNVNAELNGQDGIYLAKHIQRNFEGDANAYINDLYERAKGKYTVGESVGSRIKSDSDSGNPSDKDKYNFRKALVQNIMRWTEDDKGKITWNSNALADAKAYLPQGSVFKYNTVNGGKDPVVMYDIPATTVDTPDGPITITRKFGTIKLRDVAAANELNNVIGRYSGNKVSMESFNTTGGKNPKPVKITPKVTKAKSSGTVSYNVNGTIYNIPASEAKGFLKDFPNAKKQG